MSRPFPTCYHKSQTRDFRLQSILSLWTSDVCKLINYHKSRNYDISRNFNSTSLCDKVLDLCLAKVVGVLEGDREI